MEKITEKFKDLAKKKEVALIIGTVPGYPNLETSFEIIKTIVKSGADILELSSSFSDPIADGPTLTQTHQKILSLGISKNQIFDFYKKVTQSFDIPIFVIEYANIVYKISLDKYFGKLKNSGIETLIMPDVPLEELRPFSEAASKYKINLALLVAPTTPNLRIKKVAKKSKSFLYAVSVTGVTGVRKKISSQTIDFLKRARKLTFLPLVVGFGISEPRDIKILAKLDIDGVVICSKIINIINKGLSNEKGMLRELGNYIARTKKATFL